VNSSVHRGLRVIVAGLTITGPGISGPPSLPTLPASSAAASAREALRRHRRRHGRSAGDAQRHQRPSRAITGGTKRTLAPQPPARRAPTTARCTPTHAPQPTRPYPRAATHATQPTALRAAARCHRAQRGVSPRAARGFPQPATMAGVGTRGPPETPSMAREDRQRRPTTSALLPRHHRRHKTHTRTPTTGPARPNHRAVRPNPRTPTHAQRGEPTNLRCHKEFPRRPSPHDVCPLGMVDERIHDIIGFEVGEAVAVAACLVDFAPTCTKPQLGVSERGTRGVRTRDSRCLGARLAVTRGSWPVAGLLPVRRRGGLPPPGRCGCRPRAPGPRPSPRCGPPS
jgi:hypothetical protein